MSNKPVPVLHLACSKMVQIEWLNVIAKIFAELHATKAIFTNFATNYFNTFKPAVGWQPC